jgi:hypothetical protein
MDNYLQTYRQSLNTVTVQGLSTVIAGGGGVLGSVNRRADGQYCYGVATTQRGTG